MITEKEIETIISLPREEQVNWLGRMTPQEKLLYYKVQIGFEEMPPTIEEFIFDPYYLGNTIGKSIYPFWVEKLKQTYPNPIFSRYQYAAPGGAIGIGKSTYSMVNALYDYCKLLHLKDAWETCNIDQTTRFTIRCFNLTKEKANDIFINPLYQHIEMSQFFQENIERFPLKIQPAKNAKDVISECMIFALVSEVNFYPPEVARDILSTCANRIQSRLGGVKNIFGRIMLDSSATGKDAVMEEFIKRKDVIDDTIVIRASQWEAKKGTNTPYFVSGEFHVYAGDSQHSAHIIQEGEDTSALDKDLIIRCPNELKSHFISDINKALNELAGVDAMGSNDFIPNKETLAAAFVKENPFGEGSDDCIFTLPFYGQEQLYDIIGEKVLSALPEDRKIYCRTDLGISHDMCGMAISYVDEATYMQIEDRQVFTPTIVTPVAFGVSRLPGEQTNIEKIINFWIWLSQKRQIASVTTDQYQSTIIRQQMMTHNINTEYLSVDTNDTAYVEFKNLIMMKRWKAARSSYVLDELSNLQRVGKKIDHKTTSTKDVSDAIVGTVFKALQDGEAAVDPTSVNKMGDFVTMLKSLKELHDQRAIAASARIYFGA